MKYLFIDFTKVVLWHQEGSFWVLSDIRLIKILLKHLRASRFYDAQDIENEFEWLFDSMNHRFIDFSKDVP
jgi:hypothetical protein